MKTEVFQGILIPFLGTTLGSACVLFMKNRLNQMVQRALTGFAAGVMVAASIWSLLIPAMEQSEPMGKLSFLPAAVGFWLGILFLLLLDRAVPHLHMNSSKAEGPESSLQKQVLLVLAAALTILAAGFVVPLLPYLLSFAAGAMVYVVVEELIPEMSEGKHSNVGTVLFAAGFTIMMVLDVALG